LKYTLLITKIAKITLLHNVCTQNNKIPMRFTENEEIELLNE